MNRCPTCPRVLRVASLALLLAGCASAPTPTTRPPSQGPVAPPPSAASKYYKDDGPGANPPANLDAVPDAVPRVEALHRSANRPYTVLGRDYVPATSLRPYRERGVASWYGRKFHGERTSTGEVYDMYAMTAAHPTLPIPSYARVTNPANGRSVVVRVNDRGPFLRDRIIDLSYAAAHRLGIAEKGSGEVEVESIIPVATIVAAAPLPPVAVPATAPPAGLPAAAGEASLAERPAAAAMPASAADEAVLVARATEPIAAPDVAQGYVVQLGAFANYANAQAFLAHVQNQTATAQVEAKVRQANGLFRVYVGPYAAREDARKAAERITRAFGFATTVAPNPTASTAP